MVVVDAAVVEVVVVVEGVVDGTTGIGAMIVVKTSSLTDDLTTTMEWDAEVQVPALVLADMEATEPDSMIFRAATGHCRL